MGIATHKCLLSKALKKKMKNLAKFKLGLSDSQDLACPAYENIQNKGSWPRRTGLWVRAGTAPETRSGLLTKGPEQGLLPSS